MLYGMSSNRADLVLYAANEMWISRSLIICALVCALDCSLSFHIVNSYLCMCVILTVFTQKSFKLCLSKWF